MSLLVTSYVVTVIESVGRFLKQLCSLLLSLLQLLLLLLLGLLEMLESLSAEVSIKNIAYESKIIVEGNS